MAKYFIGGVANVKAFDGEDLVFNAKTLTDSSINISVSAEEIRGGEGAQLLGKFFHTTVFNLSLTDALFDMNYLAKQTGSNLEDGRESVVFKKYNVTTASSSSTITLGENETIADIVEGGSLYCFDEKDNQKFVIVQSSTTGTITVPEGKTAPTCVIVPIVASGSQVKVDAQYIPQTLHLYMEAKLFAGDACQASSGKYAGKVLIEIPRFQLDGTIDLAMAMSSPATFALNGSALASGCDCNGGSYYAKITQVLGSNLD